MSARIWWLGGALACLAAIILGIAYLDRPIAYWAHGLDPTLVAICARVTLAGDSAWYLPPLAIAIPALYIAMLRSPEPARAARLRRLLWAAIFLFAAIALSGLLVDLLKILFGRSRPVLLLREGYFGWQPFSLKGKLHSFPSGHANTLLALGTAIGLLWDRLRWPALALAILVAATRVVIGQHYLSDVIAGGALGIVTTLWLHDAFARRDWLGGRDSRARRFAD